MISLQTANSGTANFPLPLSFNVLVFTFNSTDNSTVLTSEDERYNSSEYTNNESVLVNINDIMELNQLYQFAAIAVNIFGASDISPLSDPVLLNVSGILQQNIYFQVII